MPKQTIELTQIEIQEALREYLDSKYGVSVKDVKLNVERGYSDPREHIPDTVTAVARIDMSANHR